MSGAADAFGLQHERGTAAAPSLQRGYMDARLHVGGKYTEEVVRCYGRWLEATRARPGTRFLMNMAAGNNKEGGKAGVG